MAITTKKLIAEEYVVSSSVTLMTQSLSSGSTVFGDSVDDTHRMTGSLFVSGGISTDGSAGGTATFKGSSTQSTLNLQSSVDNFVVGLSNSSGRLDLRPGGTTALTAVNSGNVGIGDQSPTEGRLVVAGTGGYASPPLHISMTDSGEFNHFVNMVDSNLTAGENGIIVFGQELATKNAAYIGYKHRSDHGDDNQLTLGFWSANNLVNLLPNGNFGIGTEAPSKLLHLDSSSGYAEMRLSGTSGGGTLEFYNDSTALGDVYFDTNKKFYVRTGGATTALTIDASQNVGIGTTNPQKILEVIVPENNFVSFALQHSPGSHAGIHFGYRENNNVYRHSQLRFQRTDRFANNAMGRIMLINKTGTDSANPGESDAHLTIDELGFVGIGRNVGGHYSTGPRIQALLHVSASSVVGTATASLHVEGSGSLVVSVDGTQGRLFSITDELSGSLFSANTISGLPVIEAFSDNKVTLGPYSNPVTVTSTGNISGSATSTGSFGDGRFIGKVAIFGSGSKTPDTPLHIRGDFDGSGGLPNTNPNKGLNISKFTGLQSDYGKGDKFGITFTAASNATSDFALAGIYGQVTNVSSYVGGSLIFATRLETENALTAKMAISSSGNVGIGETSPNRLLDITPGSRTSTYSAADASTWADIIVRNKSGNQNTATGIAFYNNSAYHSNAGTGIAAVKAVDDGDYPSDLAFITRRDGATATEKMRITHDLKVGIGTNAPGATLDIGGGAVADPTVLIDSAAGGDPQLHFDTSASNRTGIIQFKDQGTVAGFINYVHNGDKMNFGAASSTSVRMVVSEPSIEFPTANVKVSGSATSTGSFGELHIADKVGIGTTSPGVALEVRDATANNGHIGGKINVAGDYNETNIAYGGNRSPGVTIQSLDSTAGTFGTISFMNASGYTGATIIAKHVLHGAGTGNMDTQLHFGTRGIHNVNSGAHNPSAMVIDEDGNVGIGTTSPETKLHVDDTASTPLTLKSFGTDVFSGINIISSKGTAASPTDINEANYVIGKINFMGRESSGDRPGATIQAVTEGVWTGTGHATRLEFLTGPGNQYAMTEKMRIDKDGNVTIRSGSLGIGHTSPEVTLQVMGDTTISGSDSSALDLVVRNHHGTGLSRIIAQNNNVDMNAQLVADDANNVASVGSTTGGSKFIKFIGGGTNAYFDGGNFGIGNSSPPHPLTVTGVISGSGTGYFSNIILGGTEQIAVNNGNLYYTGGNLGIGLSAPTSPIHVRNGKTSSIPNLLVDDSTGHNAILEVTSLSNSADAFITIGSQTNRDTSLRFNENGSISFQIKNDTSADSLAIKNANGTDLMTLLQTGNVGIGLTNPTGSLHVMAAQPEVIIQNSTQDGSSTMLRLTEAPIDGKAGGYLHYDGSANKFHIGTHISGTDTKKITILRSGTVVGIGTDAPETALLHVYGSNNSAGVTFTSIGAGNIPHIVVQNAGTTSNNNAGYFFKDNDGYVGGVGMRFTDHSPNKSKLIFSTANTNTREIGAFNESGSLGVGLTTPEDYEGSANNLVVKDYYDGTNAGITIVTGTTSKGKIHFADGTSGNASYRGYILYDHNSDAGMSFGTSGTERVRIDGSGQVGINKTSPTDTLHVAGGITMEASNAILAMNVTNTTGACQIRFGDTGDSDIGKIVYGHNTNAMSFNTADAERLRIDSSGNVGIGTDDPGSYKLNVNGTGFFGANLQCGADLRLYNGTTIRFHGNGVVGMNASATTQTFGSTGGSVNSHFSVGGVTAAMMISGSTGNVGIGNLRPQHRLDVYGTDDVTMRIHRPSSGLGSNDSCGIGFSQRSDTSISTSDVRAGIFSIYNGEMFLATEAAGNLNSNPIDHARLYIDGAGLVGIGTTNPLKLLHVDTGTVAGSTIEDILLLEGAVGGSGTTGLGIVFSHNGSNHMSRIAGTYHNSNSDLQGNLDFYTGYSSPSLNMRIDATGRVGIGELSPSAKLQIKGGGITVSGSNDTSAIQAMLIKTSAASSQGLIGVEGSGTGFIGSSIARAMIVSSTATGTALQLGSAGSVRMTIASTGNVGIRKTNPDAPLDVSTSGGSGTAIILRNTSTVAMAINANADGSFTMFDYEGGGYNSSITSQGGNIGIGDTTPSYKLDVNGTGRFTGQVIVPGGSNTTPGLMFDSSNDGFFHDTADPGQGIKMMVNNANDFLFANGGDFHADGSLISNSTTISDSRFKTNISTITSPVDKVKQLRGVTFDWMKGKQSGSADIGVIAQEVEAVFPELVQNRPLPLWETKDASISGSYKTVDYERLAAVLIESVKEQQTKLEQLEAEIEKLKGG